MPLFVTSLSSLINMWYTKRILLCSLVRSLHWFMLKVSLKCSYFIYDLAADSHFSFQIFVPDLRYNCVIMTASASGSFSINYWQNIIWASECKVSLYSTWVFSVSYFLTNILGIYSCLVFTFTREDLHATGIASGVEFLVGDVITGGSFSNTVSIICSATYGITSSLASDGKPFIYFYSYYLIVVMSCCYTKSSSVSDLADIGLRSVSGSTNSMCGASVSPSSTTVISRSPFGCFL